MLSPTFRLSATAPCIDVDIAMSATPSFSAEEIRRREQTLLRCFDCCDTNGDGVIDARELEAVARAFTSANTSNSNSNSNSNTQGSAHSSGAAAAAVESSTASTQQAGSAGMNVDQVTHSRLTRARTHTQPRCADRVAAVLLCVCAWRRCAVRRCE